MSNVQTGGPMRFYSAGEVAGMFGVSRMTIYRAINDGTIPAIQVRDRWVVPAVAVDGMVQAAIARAEALSGARSPEDDVGLLDRYVDRPRLGANPTGPVLPLPSREQGETCPGWRTRVRMRTPRGVRGDGAAESVPASGVPDRCGDAGDGGCGPGHGLRGAVDPVRVAVDRGAVRGVVAALVRVDRLCAPWCVAVAA